MVVKNILKYLRSIKNEFSNDGDDDLIVRCQLKI